MKEFDRMQEVLNRLLGPGGCPWDQEQTLESLRGAILEEAYEVIDAIDLGDNSHIAEELGDLFWGVLFMCMMLEKEGRGTLKEVLQGIADKLVYRHPHVFGDVKLGSSEEVIKQWDEIKKKEKKERKSVLDGLPKGMPSLMRAQKVFKRLRSSDYRFSTSLPEFADEEELGQKLLALVRAAQAKGLDAELALNKALTHQEADVLAWEQTPTAEHGSSR